MVKFLTRSGGGQDPLHLCKPHSVKGENEKYIKHRRRKTNLLEKKIIKRTFFAKAPSTIANLWLEEEAK